MRIARVLDASDPRHDEEERRLEAANRLRHQKNNVVVQAFEPSEKQTATIDRLLGELQDIDPDVYATASNWYAGVRDTMSRKDASKVIARLKFHCGYEEQGWNKRAGFASPRVDLVAKVPVVRAPEPIDYFDDIPDGYYALHDADEPGDHIKFFRVSTWKTSFNGESRPSRKVQSVIGGDRLGVLKRAAGRTVLREIREVGFKLAAKLYADKIGRCHRCNLLLTDEHSRAVGMGRTCESKGW